MMCFSLVIPTYNRASILRRCLIAATAQDYPNYEVIVVDDASTDGTGQMVQSEFPQVRYFRQEVNRGPAAARNRGIEEAGGKVIAFTDDDCLVPCDFLSALADGYRRYPDVVGVGGYQEAAAEVLQVSCLARYEQYVSRHIYHVGTSECVGGFECPAGGTNSMSYRRHVLEQVGGFDETFPMAAGEDAYLKWQIVQRGYSLLFVPVKVTHLQDYTMFSFLSQQVRRGIGAAHFEWRLYRHYPRPGHIVLRSLKRTTAFLPALVRMGPALAGIHVLGGWADAYGQYIAWRQYRPCFEGREQA